MNFKKIQAMVFAFLGIKVTNEPLNLTEDQKKALDAQVKQKGFAEKFQARHNEITQAEQENADAMKAIEEFMAEETSPEDEENPESIPSAQEGVDQSLTVKFHKVVDENC